MQPCVVGGHFGGGVVEDFADYFLGHVVVDQTGAEGMTELVGGEMDWYLVFITDIAGQNPGLECGVEDVGAGDRGAVGVVLDPGEQCCGWGVGLADVGDLGADLAGHLFGDRHQRFAFHFSVEVAKVGRTIAVAD